MPRRPAVPRLPAGHYAQAAIDARDTAAIYLAIARMRRALGNHHGAATAVIKARFWSRAAIAFRRIAGHAEQESDQ
jgi:hypothetical protein